MCVYVCVCIMQKFDLFKIFDDDQNHLYSQLRF